MMNKSNATHPLRLFQFDTVDAETCGVMKNHVNPGVNIRYGTQNQKFLI